ncbi:MAG: M23 family metallopeptidase [Alcaligenaceae bacterium]
MKVVIMPRERVAHGIFSLSLSRSLLCGIALLVTALYAGACLQRVFEPTYAGRSGVAGQRASAPLEVSYADKQSFDSLLRQLGVLQANYQRLDAISRRVAGLAGLSATDLQIVSENDDMVRLKPEAPPKLGARVEQQLRALQATMVKKTEQFMLLDLTLTKHAARVARKPTAMPIASVSQLSSAYGWRLHPFHAEPSLHEGLDFAAPSGTPILAASGGVVRTAASQSSFGNLIEIDHGEGLLTRYAHAKVLLVKKGDLVVRGQMIARVGSTGLSTGPHLHFEVRQHDKPIDPRIYLTGSPNRPASAPIDALR